MALRFSIITPSFNSGSTLERSVESVLAQNYQDFEHLIIDGESSDNTREILKKYPHLRWVSEPDKGQVDAMNKGFSMAEGDIIGYLNADDYYLEGAFSAAAETFKDREVKMVVGKIRVYSEENDSWWVNDPAVDFDSMIRHWEMNAFCVNPVGYFYRREVQEQVPLNPENDDKHDLEFLIGVADRFQEGIRKVDQIFGEFIHSRNTKTAKEQQQLDYWRQENFVFLDRFLENRSPEYQEEFRARQACGYQVRTNWEIKKAIHDGRADSSFKNGNLLILPVDTNSCHPHTAFADGKYNVTPGNAVVVVLCSGKVGSSSIAKSLQSIPEEVSAYPVYSFHHFVDPKSTIHDELKRSHCIGYSHLLPGHAMRYVWDRKNSGLKWKFIAGVRDPIAQMVSAHYENQAGQPIRSKTDFYDYVIRRWPYRSDFFRREYEETIGIDIFKYSFNQAKGYTIITQGNVEILLYTLEKLNSIFAEAMLEFLGIPEAKIVSANEAKLKSYKASYQKATSSLENSFTEAELDQFYSHNIVTHFYSEEQIRVLRSRWEIPAKEGDPN